MKGICPKCKVSPSTKYNSYCRTCHLEVQKKYYKNRPKSIIDSTLRRKEERKSLSQEKRNKPCMDCGRSYPFYVMDFDHVRGEKKFNISCASARMVTIENLLEEISKCDVVCSNCHRERTWKRKNL